MAVKARSGFAAACGTLSPVALFHKVLPEVHGQVPDDANNTITYRFHNNGNLVRAGLNYRF